MKDESREPANNRQVTENRIGDFDPGIVLFNGHHLILLRIVDEISRTPNGSPAARLYTAQMMPAFAVKEIVTRVKVEDLLRLNIENLARFTLIAKDADILSEFEYLLLDEEYFIVIAVGDDYSRSQSNQPEA